MKISCLIRAIATLAIFLAFPVAAFAQGMKTTTVSNSAGSGKTNARFVWTTETTGPAAMAIGDLGSCTIPEGPYPSATCASEGGKGSLEDPLRFKCSAALALAGCTLAGTELKILAGSINVNTHTHLQTAKAPQIAGRSPR